MAFKPNSSTVLCSTMVNETVQYYTENGGKPVYVLLLDASKAFDKVAFNVLFNELRNKSMCPRITKLLYYMYTNQVCSVKWDNELSDCFNVSNGIKHGGVISPLLFSCYILIKSVRSITTFWPRLPCRLIICWGIWLC